MIAKGEVNAPFVIGSELGYDSRKGQTPTGEETRAMRTSFSVNDMTIHHGSSEQEAGFTPMLDFTADIVEGNPRREPRLAGARRL